jgi:hypothetical protein
MSFTTLPAWMTASQRAQCTDAARQVGDFAVDRMVHAVVAFDAMGNTDRPLCPVHKCSALLETPRPWVCSSSGDGLLAPSWPALGAHHGIVCT